MHFNALDHPPDFIETIKNIINTTTSTLSKSPIMFDFSKVAMNHNSDILKSFNYDSHSLINAFPNSDLSCGKEFRPVDVLEPLLHRHPNWKHLKICLT